MSDMNATIQSILDSFRISSPKEEEKLDSFDYTTGTKCYKVVQLYHGKLYSCAFNPKKENSYLTEYKFDTFISPNNNWTNGIYTFNKPESANYYRHIEIFGRPERTIKTEDCPIYDYNEKTGNMFIILIGFGFNQRYPILSAFFHDIDSLSQFYIKKLNNHRSENNERYEYGQTYCFDKIYIPSERNTFIINYLKQLNDNEITKLTKHDLCAKIQAHCDMEKLNNVS